MATQILYRSGQPISTNLKPALVKPAAVRAMSMTTIWHVAAVSGAGRACGWKRSEDDFTPDCSSLREIIGNRVACPMQTPADYTD